MGCFVPACKRHPLGEKYMENTPLISIIVPVYKAEKYLPACIESLLAQTYKNMEFILVDDGSPDNSLKICQEYAAKDSRLRIIHQENAGCATARNTGLAAAKGEYVGFVDSDDIISAKTYQVALETLVQTKADWVMWNMSVQKTYLPAGFLSGAAYQQALCNSILNRGMGPSVCVELFRMDIIRRHQIHFRPEIKRGDDLFFVLHYGRYAQNIYYLKDKHFYHYVYNPQSLSHSFHSDAFDYPLKHFTALKDIFAPLEGSVYLPYVQARFARDLQEAFNSYMHRGNPLPFWKRLKKAKAFMEQDFVKTYLKPGYENYLPKQQALIVWLLEKKQYVLARFCQSAIFWLRTKKWELKKWISGHK